MDKNVFKSKAEELLKKLEDSKSYPIDGLLKTDIEKSIETDILIDFTNLVHAFDCNHPIKKMLYDTFSYNLLNRGLGNEQKRVLEYCIKKVLNHLDDFAL